MKKYLFLISWLLLSSIVLAEIPRQITVQGILTDNSGVPLPSGSYTFQFNITDSFGNLIWSETQDIIVKDGLFNAFLNTPENALFDKPYFLEVTVNGNVLEPRVRITSSGYAFTAGNVVTPYVEKLKLDKGANFAEKTFISDVNKDGSIDYKDLSLMFQKNFNLYGCNSNMPCWNKKIGVDNLGNYIYGKNLDFNKDNEIDIFDLILLTENYEPIITPYKINSTLEINGVTYLTSDINKDGFIDSSDLTLFFTDNEIYGCNSNMPCWNKKIGVDNLGNYIYTKDLNLAYPSEETIDLYDILAVSNKFSSLPKYFTYSEANTQFPAAEFVCKNNRNYRDFIVQIKNEDDTNGESNGLLIKAGNGNRDYPLYITNRTDSPLLSVRGDGMVNIKNKVIIGKDTETEYAGLDVINSEPYGHGSIITHTYFFRDMLSTGSGLTYFPSDTKGWINIENDSMFINLRYSVEGKGIHFLIPGGLSGRTIMSIMSNGYVGIGTTPNYPLDVNGWARIQGSDFMLGTNDGRAIGSKTRQRALVHDNNDVLVINYEGDFEGGTKIDSNLTVSGNVLMGWEIKEDSCSGCVIKTISCTTGKKVIGGGCLADPPATLRGSYPGSSGDRWECVSSQSTTIIGRVICARISS